MTEPKTPTTDDRDDAEPTEVEQPILKRAEDSGEDATGGMGIATGVAQA